MVDFSYYFGMETVVRVINVGPLTYKTIFLLFLLLLGLPNLARADQAAPPTNKVYLSIELIDIDNIDSKKQSFLANIKYRLRWFDPSLKNVSPRPILKPLVEVWQPKVAIINDQMVKKFTPDVVEVRPNGEVIYNQRLWGNFSLPMYLRDFPFDSQTIFFQFASLSYSPNELMIVSDPLRRSVISDRFTLPDWKITQWGTKNQPYRITQDSPPTAGFQLYLLADRDRDYYIIAYFIPLFIITAMAYLVFCFPIEDTGGRMRLASTALLTLIAYRFLIATTLPTLSYLTNMDIILLVSLGYVFIIIIFTAIIAECIKIHRKKGAEILYKWFNLISFGLLISILVYFVYIWLLSGC